MTILRMIEEQAVVRPEASAVQAAGERLTYAQLVAEAERFAAALRGVEVQPGERVLLFAERTVHAVAAVLGTWKVGAVYVPVDPSWPDDRVRSIALAAKPAAALSPPELRERLPAVRALWLGESPTSPSGRTLQEEGREDSLAYIIFTSGSTGEPKGVQIDHSAIVPVMGAIGEGLRIGPGCTLVGVAPLSFDMSIQDLLLPLSTGATLVLATREEARDGWKLAQLLDATAATHLTATPSTWSMLLDAGYRARGRLTAICGGDALTNSLARALLEEGITLYNFYGPTEATVWCCYDRVVDASADISIGRAFGPHALHVVDSNLVPLPDGEVGELCVSGAALSRGYLDPELTRARFVTPVSGPLAGVRLYRTGDLARRTHGRLFHHGRTDDQVKLRGYRIELGDVAAALERCDGVEQAVAAVREGGMLVGYVRWRGTPGEPQRLRAALRALVPEYMVPSTFVSVAAFPLTPNGKVDRRALPAPPAMEAPTAETEPLDDTERALNRIFAELLEVAAIRPSDDFLALGVHSLMLTRVSTAIERALRVRVDVRTILECGTMGRLARWIRDRGAQGAEAIPTVPRDGPVGASAQQEELWYVQQLDGSSPIYNVAFTIDFEGPLQCAALEQALRALFERHQVLESTLRLHGGQLQIAPGARAAVNLEPVDLLHTPKLERSQRARELAVTSASEPFDLARGPLARVVLLRLGPTSHRLVVTAHHLVFDGVSQDIFVRELAALYGALVADQPQPLSKRPAQFRDFAHWQQAQRDDQRLARTIAFWKDGLRGVPWTLSFPSDRPRPPWPSQKGSTVDVSLSPDLTQQLRALARAEGATLFTTLLSGYAAALARYASQQQFVIAAPFSVRTKSELEGMIGHMVNLLPLPVDVSGTPSARALVRRTSAFVLGALAHQEVSFQDIVVAVNPARDPTRPTRYQVGFAFQDHPARDLQGGGCRISGRYLHLDVAKSDLTLMLEEGDSGVDGVLEFNTDIFDPATVTRFVRHFIRQLEGMVAAPDSAVSSVQLLSEDERRHILKELAPPASLAPRRCLHDEFARRAREAPDAVALSLDDVILTYGQLNALADALAQHLRSQGVQLGSRVGLFFDRSFELVIAILGTLKAGAAYVPIDPATPAQRTSFLLTDAGVAGILTHRAVAGSLPETDAPVWLIDETTRRVKQAAPWPRADDGADVPAGTPDATAYLIYTSGSTGRPKGVVVTHAMACAFVEAATEMYPYCRSDTGTLFQSYAFDPTVMELWCLLLNGGRVVIVPYATSRAPDRFRELLRKERVTWMATTPAAFKALMEVECSSSDSPLPLKAFCVGGEALDFRSLKPWIDRFGDEQARVINVYGPTETTVLSTFKRVGRAELTESGSVIGRPLPNSEIYILDEWLCPVPFGVMGEICIAGASVASGYHGRPELTAERFIPEPFSGRPGARMYRSGDFGRLRPNGELEYVGRLDHQVKIRGFRIELGEIEEELRRLPGVRDAVVLALEESGAKVLSAYIATRGAAQSSNQLRAALSSRLPPYMVPARWFLLRALPLNSNGKVDGHALAALQAAEEPPAAEEQTTWSTIERNIAEVWVKLLNVPAVHRDSDFFALGGTSLTSVRVVSALAARGIDVSLRQVVTCSTLRELAKAAVPRPRLAEIERLSSSAGPQRVVPASFAELRWWLTAEASHGYPPPQIISVVFELQGKLAPRALTAAVESLLKRQDALRARFSWVNGELIKTIHEVVSVQLTPAHLSDNADLQRFVDRATDAMTEALVPGGHNDLANEPLVRFRLATMQGRGYLIMLAHHIVFDAASISIVETELAERYAEQRDGVPAQLPELPFQIDDHSEWERSWLASEEGLAQRDFWKARLQGAAETSAQLPADLPGARVRAARERHPFAGTPNAYATFSVSETVSTALDRLSRQWSATGSMLRLAALGMLLKRICNTDEAVIYNSHDMRKREGMESLVGYLSNPLLLRLSVAGEPSWEELVQRAKAETLTAFAHDDVPIVPGILAQPNALCRILFVYTSSSAASSSPVLRRTEIETTRRVTSPYDLAISTDGSRGVLYWSSELFSEERGTSWARQYAELLEELAAQASEAAG